MYTFLPDHCITQNVNISRRKCTLISLAFLECSISMFVYCSCSHVSSALLTTDIESHTSTSLQAVVIMYFC